MSNNLAAEAIARAEAAAAGAGARAAAIVSEKKSMRST